MVVAGGRRLLLLLLVYLGGLSPEEHVEADDDKECTQQAADGDEGAQQQRVQHRGGHQRQRVKHGRVDGPPARDGPGHEAEGGARVEGPHVHDGRELQVPAQPPRRRRAAAGLEEGDGGADEQRLQGAGDAGEHGGERVGHAAAAEVDGAQAHVVVGRGHGGGGVVPEHVRGPRRAQQGALVEAGNHGAAHADGRARHLHPPRQLLLPEHHRHGEGHHRDEVEEVDGVGGGGGAQAVVVKTYPQHDPQQRADRQPAKHPQVHLAQHPPAYAILLCVMY
uniref:Uncharacterized protein n=1 Tax=Setaria italica TaxID=4555 RepID=K3YUU6_SETIT